jgi:hypothetical protein
MATKRPREEERIDIKNLQLGEDFVEEKAEAMFYAEIKVRSGARDMRQGVGVILIVHCVVEHPLLQHAPKNPPCASLCRVTDLTLRWMAGHPGPCQCPAGTRV